MTDGNQIARELLRRLLAGERTNAPLHLAMLLERSSALDHGDEHYREILPERLANIRLDRKTVDDITHILCEEISRNPDSDLLFAVASTGAAEVTRLASKLLVEPPRPLTDAECAQALGIIEAYLPSALATDSNFLPFAIKKALTHTLDGLRNSKNISIQGHATRLLVQLRRFGIEGA